MDRPDDADSLLIVTPIVGFCNCSMFCCALLYFHSRFAIILMGKREADCCFFCLIVVWLFLTMTRFCLQFVIVVFSNHTHYFCLLALARIMLETISFAIMHEAVGEYPVQSVTKLL